MKFTKEEISLCKQVTKKHRKEIKKGDWYKDLNVVGGNLDLCDRNAGFYYKYLNENEEIIPLWTISDCLEFLREKGYRVKIDEEITVLSLTSSVKCYGHKSNIAVCKFGTTPLEACLKAVLAVLEVPNG